MLRISVFCLKLKSVIELIHSHSSLLATGGGPGRGCVGRVSLTAQESLLEGNTVCHSTHRVLTFKFLKLSGSVLVEELVQGEVAAANSDLNLVTNASDHHALGAELVSALGLAHEHDLELLTVRVVVDVLRKFLVDGVIFDRDVDGDA